MPPVKSSVFENFLKLSKGHYTCMIVIMIMQRIMTCYMHINLSLLTFVVMWNWSGSGNWN